MDRFKECDINLIQLENLFDYIADQKDRHQRSSSWWCANNEVACRDIALIHNKNNDGSFSLGPIKNLIFPFFEFGAITSRELFGLDELIIFSFYWRNRNQYRSVGDFGANIGLHSIILALIGYKVISYEPDPDHLTQFNVNKKLNKLENIKIIPNAVNEDGKDAIFTRILGNTTGSHILGAKENIYGKTDIIKVKSTSIIESIKGLDLVKMDVEGFEAKLIVMLQEKDFSNLDIIAELGSEKNATLIFDHLSHLNVNIFSQKINWGKVHKFSELPNSYKEGSVFISKKEIMPW